MSSLIWVCTVCPDKVLVTGPYDQYGYYEAEVNGQVGLVPASYLQPLLQQRTGNLQVCDFSKLDRRLCKIL